MAFRFRPDLVLDVVKRLGAVADESRIHILIRLRKAEVNVTTLTKDLNIVQASVSKHLAVLRQAGIVSDRLA